MKAYILTLGCKVNQYESQAMLETAWESRWMPDSLWGCSSVGRAPALQAGGQEFESLHLHSVRNIKLCN